jgi:hypothetical protein
MEKYLSMTASSLSPPLYDVFTVQFGTAGFTVLEGNRNDLLGLFLEFDRDRGRVIVTQRNFV